MTDDRREGVSEKSADSDWNLAVKAVFLSRETDDFVSRAEKNHPVG